MPRPTPGERFVTRLLKGVVFGLLLLPFASLGEAPGTAGDAPERLILSAPLTHTDWMLRDTVAGVVWGAEGVRHMLDTCKACGWSRIYWRVLDGGRALYSSALLKPQGKWDADNFWRPASAEDRRLTEEYTGMEEPAREALLGKIERYDYSQFDTLAEAVRYGHEIGLEIHAWISVNEDDHGWGLQSRFTQSHPESRWRKRNGTLYRSQQSFAFPAVMEYKLAIVKEILDGYNIDGLFLDWIRTGDIRDNPQNDAEGVADRGYEEPLVRGFIEEYGVDPRGISNGDARWVAYRARPHTEFMREVRKLAKAKRPDLPVAVLVGHPWMYRGRQDWIDGNLRGMLLDVRSWAREGLIDAAAPAGYYMRGGTPESAYMALKEETENRVDVWFYAWVPSTPAAFLEEFGRAKAAGARQILFWEADYIDGNPERAAVQESMRGRAEWPTTGLFVAPEGKR